MRTDRGTDMTELMAAILKISLRRLTNYEMSAVIICFGAFALLVSLDGKLMNSSENEGRTFVFRVGHSAIKTLPSLTFFQSIWRHILRHYPHSFEFIINFSFPYGMSDVILLWELYCNFCDKSDAFLIAAQWISDTFQQRRTNATSGENCISEGPTT